MYTARFKDNVSEWVSLLGMGRALLLSPKGQNASRDGLVKIGWMVYSLLLFSCMFSPSVTNC